MLQQPSTRTTRYVEPSKSVSLPGVVPSALRTRDSPARAARALVAVRSGGERSLSL